MKPGEIYWIDYPSSGGHEQAGRRPSLILQDDGYAAKSPLVLTIPLTTTSATMRFPAVVPVAASAQNGLAADSYILVFQIRATDRNRVMDPIGDLESVVLSAVFDAVDKLMGRISKSPKP